MLLVMVIYRLSFSFQIAFWQIFIWNICGKSIIKTKHWNKLLCLFIQAAKLLFSLLARPYAHTVFAVSNSWVMLLFSIFWLVAQTVVSGSLWIFDKGPTGVSSPYPLSSRLSVPPPLHPLISVEAVLGHNFCLGYKQGQMPRDTSCLPGRAKNHQFPTCSASHLGHAGQGILIHSTCYSAPVDFWSFKFVN